MRHLCSILAIGLPLTGCFDIDKSDDDDDDGASGDSGRTEDGGASDGGASDGGSGDSGSSDGGGEDWDAIYVSCSWDSSGFTIDIAGADDLGFQLGFAEVDSSSPEPWTGEDCSYVGFTTGDGTYYDYCHPLPASGGSLAQVYSLEDIVPGSTTIMSAVVETTYYLYEVDTGTCWTWGVTGDYFYDCIDATGVLVCAGD